MMTLPLILSPEVEKARASGTPIVALESTIITHGMPFPQNVETARRVEDEVRRHGACPATIAIKDRRIAPHKRGPEGAPYVPAIRITEGGEA